MESRLPVDHTYKGKVHLLMDDARPHPAKTTQSQLKLNIVWPLHPHYSPDLSPCDFHAFRSLEHFSRGRQFHNNDDIARAVDEWTVCGHFTHITPRISLPVIFTLSEVSSTSAVDGSFTTTTTSRAQSTNGQLFNVSSMRYLFCKNNKIRALPDSHESSNLLSCVLYNNLLTELPSDFLLKCSRLRHLNVSFNRLSALPAVSSKTDRNRIHTLRLSSNRLDESIVPVLMKMKRLKVLDLSHNRLRYFDDSALCSLNMLEELNLSSNELTSLSPSIFELPALQVLKVHSNRIRTIPDLSVSSTLQTVDMSNNVLGVFASGISIGPSLSQLDLTCNSALNLTSGTLRRSHKKPVALFDIGSEPQDRVQMGFSETSGSRNK
ncbi:unnamed protein product [Heligmosomoides polygyrus]|uniref:Leucine Rich repeat-containing domain protein n=1 Tax=Heligmosomoides polygyrus TaxID=6339 RepID=A0A183FSB6_HELPZ|nr:unnamed protein product [Heligmosomoides polygyrus]